MPPETPKAAPQSFTAADVQAIVESAVKAAVHATSKKPEGSPLTPDERYAEMMQSQRIDKKRPTPPETRVKVTSTTGATFVAVIAPSSTYPAGRIVTLEDYTWPAGVDKHESDGGLIPDGLPLDRENLVWKHHVFQNITNKDWRAYVGQPATMFQAWAASMQAAADAVAKTAAVVPA